MQGLLGNLKVKPDNVRLWYMIQTKSFVLCFGAGGNKVEQMGVTFITEVLTSEFKRSTFWCRINPPKPSDLNVLVFLHMWRCKKSTA